MVINSQFPLLIWVDISFSLEKNPNQIAAEESISEDHLFGNW